MSGYTEEPAQVTLGELAAASVTPSAVPLPADPAASAASGAGGSPPLDARVRAMLERARLRGTTPAGLPRGMSWIPHDTGRLGLAAARRRRQMARLEAKRA